MPSGTFIQDFGRELNREPGNDDWNEYGTPGVWQKVILASGAVVVLGALVSAAIFAVPAIGSLVSWIDSPGPGEPAPPSPGAEERAVTGQPDEPDLLLKEEGNFIVRVTGTEGLRFNADLGDGRQPEGRVPQEYEVEVDEGEQISAYVARPYDEEREGVLGIELVRDGKVINESETEAPNGAARVSWSPEEGPFADGETETVIVRLSGTEGLPFSGVLTTDTRSRDVEDTLPAEYEVKLDTGGHYPDAVRARFSGSYYSEKDGTLEAEIVYKGEVVERGEITAGGDSQISLQWALPEEE
jgi:hypothetical protein